MKNCSAGEILREMKYGYVAVISVVLMAPKKRYQIATEAATKDEIIGKIEELVESVKTEFLDDSATRETVQSSQD